MSWITKVAEWVIEKNNPAQERIARDTGKEVYSDALISYNNAFDRIESVNRSVNMIVNGCSGLDYDVKDSLSNGVIKGMRAKALSNLLNFRPNPFQSAQDFRKNIFTDFILEGNAFIYFDGAFIYHLPAAQVKIETDEKTFIKGYTYNSTVKFEEHEIFSFKDISSTSIYRGTSRLQSAQKSIKTLYAMQTFQEEFFKNGAMFGLVLTTDNALSPVAKAKTINSWLQTYNPLKGGGKIPVIFDNGLKPQSVTNNSFKELDFDQGIKTHGEKIMQALGVPPILLAGGNNANITPNLRLFYLETVLPINRAYISALERFFGYDVEAITSTVSALQPDIQDVANASSTLTNGGLITPDEARISLRYPAMNSDGSNKLRIPANIAGSATNPSIGGRPPGKEEE